MFHAILFFLSFFLSVNAASGPGPRRLGQTKVVNGWNVDPPFHYPWMARILLTTYYYPGQYCGGSLVHPEWILTAAHCSYETKHYYRIEIHRHDLSKDVGSEDTITRSINEIHIHPGYDDNGQKLDVALWKLDQPVEGVPVVTLDGGFYDFIGNDLTVIGWGTLADTPSQPVPDVLQRADIEIVNCQTTFYVFKERYNFHSSEMCAGLTDGFRVYDSCSGDSGGPLIDDQDGEFVQVGVVSWGVSCAQEGFPGVYARLNDVTVKNFIDGVVSLNWGPTKEEYQQQTVVDVTHAPTQEPQEQTAAPSVTPCPQGELKCKDGVCMDATFFCDGQFQCADYSDESQCAAADDFCDIKIEEVVPTVSGYYNVLSTDNGRPTYFDSVTNLYITYDEVSSTWYITDDPTLAGTYLASVQDSAISVDVIVGCWSVSDGAGGYAQTCAPNLLFGCVDCEPLYYLGDGYCDDGSYNSAQCKYDGGDCCESSCVDADFICGPTFPSCVDPNAPDALDLEGCEPLEFLGDGFCDHDYQNTAQCGWDGGDCCEQTCVPSAFECNSNGYECNNPGAGVCSVPQSYICDTIIDCVDLSDELNCGQGDACNVMIYNYPMSDLILDKLFEVIGYDVSNRPVYFDSHNELYLYFDTAWVVSNNPIVNAAYIISYSQANSADQVQECWRIFNTDSQTWKCRGNLRIACEECNVEKVNFLSDGFCDYEDGYNVEECNFDGGDCCAETCMNNLFSCGDNNYACVDPTVQQIDISPNCTSQPVYYIGDGYCDTSEFNNAACNWDGGDCCVTTCQAGQYSCGTNGYSCHDPVAGQAEPEDVLCDIHIIGREGSMTMINGIYNVVPDEELNAHPQYYDQIDDLHIFNYEGYWMIATAVGDVEDIVILAYNIHNANTPQNVLDHWTVLDPVTEKFIADTNVVAKCYATECCWAELSGSRLSGESITETANSRSECENICCFQAGCLGVKYSDTESECLLHTSLDQEDAAGGGVGTYVSLVISTCQDCAVVDPEYLGDGYCDSVGGYNSGICNFDDGDCCETTCEDNLWDCGTNGFDCLDSDAPPPGECSSQKGMLIGPEVESFDSEDPASCCQECKVEAECVAWNYLFGGLCILKSKVEKIYKSDEWIYGGSQDSIPNIIPEIFLETEVPQATEPPEPTDGVIDDESTAERCYFSFLCLVAHICLFVVM